MRLFKTLMLSLVLMTTIFVNSVYANSFVGGYNSYVVNSDTQAFATIKTPSYPDVYNGSFSNAWTMLTGSNSWAQTGWIKFSDGTIRYFFQYDKDYGTPYTIYGTYGPASNSSHNYNTYRSGSNYIGVVDSSQIASYPAGFDSYGYEFAEEIKNFDAAFIGTSSNHAIFSNIRIVENGNTVYSPLLNWRADYDGGLYTSNYYVYYINSSFECWDLRK